MDYATFLLARIAEGEKAANAATPWPWHAPLSGGVWSGTTPPVMSWVIRGTTNVTLEDAQHIARHDPARALADCAAKRRVVEMYQAAQRAIRDAASVWNDDLDAMAACSALEKVVRELASVDADHPDHPDNQ